MVRQSIHVSGVISINHTVQKKNGGPIGPPEVRLSGSLLIPPGRLFACGLIRVGSEHIRS